ncbi:MAG TPA: AIM24 family protein [Bryobacteraceae bacterium]|nr:AIM24 family protein [Bryobacteraceae bacterium]
MFCTNCGSPLQDTSNFCTSCGAQAKRPAPARAYTVPVAQPAPPAQAAPPSPSAPTPAPRPSPPPVRSAGPRTKCAWCGAEVNAGQLSCPSCGATLDVPPLTTESGWAELPGRKDMAKLQFGDSFCQIEGQYVPVADVDLAAGDSIYFTHHVLLWKDPQINITTMSLAGGWKRVFAGMPLIMTQAQGPGHVAFSRDAPGEMIALPIQPGQSVDVREHLFMLATGNVAYDWFQTNIWYTTQDGDDKETHYPVGMFMDRFSAPQSPGLLLLHASGNVFVRQLAPNQTILVKPTALIFKDPSVQMQLHFEHPRSGFNLWGRWSNRYFWLRLWGPGRVAVQSAFEHMHGEGQYLANCSPATEVRW